MKRGADLSSADLHVRKFVVRVAAQIGEVLGDGLAGIYVHGSLATGTFVRERSDIDVLVLVSGEPHAGVLRALEAALNGLQRENPAAGALEITAMRASDALHFVHPCAPLLQLNSHPWALPAQLAHVREHGIRLTGPQPRSAIGLVPWHAYMHAVLSAFESHDVTGVRNPLGAVLNACRTLHDVSVRGVVPIDKPAAAQWAVERVPALLRPTVQAALDALGGTSPAFESERVAELRRYVAQRAEPAFAKVRDGDDGDDEDVAE